MPVRKVLFNHGNAFRVFDFLEVKKFSIRNIKMNSHAFSTGGKSSIKFLPIYIITAAFLVVTRLPAFCSSAGIFTAPLTVILAASACTVVFAPGFALLVLMGNRVPASLSPGVVILGSAASGWLLFLAWFSNPLIGACSSLALLAMTMLVLNFSSVSLAWKRISVPAVVSVVVCIGYLSVAGDRGGLNYGADLIDGRYWTVMDNLIPRIIADCLINDRAGLKPYLLGDWHSSDRPPLQTGMIMVAYPFVQQAGSAFGYLLLSVAVNIFWIWGLWGFLRAVGLADRKILQTVILITLVGAVFVNSVYTWPKMLAAALSLTAGAGLLAQACPKQIRTWVVGSAAALSLLAHGAAIFALLGFALLFWGRRKEWQIRDIAFTATVAALIYLPWTSYQKYYDPPGDRLVKWHLAGVTVRDESRPPFKAIVEEYKKAGLHGIVENKLRNLRMLLGDTTAWKEFDAHGFTNRGWNDSFAGHVRQFFLMRLGPAPMLLLIGFPLLMVPKVRQAIWFKPLLGVLVSTLFIFLLFEFGSTSLSSTWLWHAPYTALLLWCVVCALAIGEMGDKWFIVFLPLHLILFVVVWDYNVFEWSACPPPMNPGIPDFGARLVAGLCLLTLISICFRSKQWLSKSSE